MVPTHKQGGPRRTDHAQHRNELAGRVCDDGKAKFSASLGGADVLDPLDVRVDIVAADRAQLDVALVEFFHILGHGAKLGRADRREVRRVREQDACGPASRAGKLKAAPLAGSRPTGATGSWRRWLAQVAAK